MRVGDIVEVPKRAWEGDEDEGNVVIKITKILPKNNDGHIFLSGKVLKNGISIWTKPTLEVNFGENEIVKFKDGKEVVEFT